MKKAVIIVLFLISCINAQSQFAKGVIIKGNDTTDITFILPVGITQKINYLRFQNKVRYYDDKDVRSIAKPIDIDEIQFSYEGEKIRMISRLEPIQYYCPTCIRRTIFFKVLVDGNVKLFEWHFQTATTSIGRSTKDYYYQKGEEELFSPNNFKFKKEMSNYFYDCESLVIKLLNKEFRKNDAEKIVNFHNTNCTQ